MGAAADTHSMKSGELALVVLLAVVYVLGDCIHNFQCVHACSVFMQKFIVCVRTFVHGIVCFAASSFRANGAVIAFCG